MLSYYKFSKGIFMKRMIVLFTVMTLSCFANQEPMPNTQGNGYTNQNQRAEYHYEKANGKQVYGR